MLDKGNVERNIHSLGAQIEHVHKNIIKLEKGETYIGELILP